MDSIWVFQAPIFQVLFHLLFFRLKYRGLLIISFKLIFLRAGFHERRRLHVQVDNLMDGFEQRTEKKFYRWTGVNGRTDGRKSVRVGLLQSALTWIMNFLINWKWSPHPFDCLFDCWTTRSWNTHHMIFFRVNQKRLLLKCNFVIKKFLTLGINFISKSTITFCKTISWFALKISFEKFHSVRSLNPCPLNSG